MFSLAAIGLSNPIHLVALILVLAFWIGPAILAGRIAERKGRSFVVYLVASLVIGWPIPLLAAAVLPGRRTDSPKRSNASKPRDEPPRPNPFGDNP
jgi:hypothetical protein